MAELLAIVVGAVLGTLAASPSALLLVAVRGSRGGEEGSRNDG